MMPVAFSVRAFITKNRIMASCHLFLCSKNQMKICIHKIKRVALPSGTMAAGYTFGRPRLSPAKSGGVIF